MAESKAVAGSPLGYRVARYWLPVLGMLAMMYWFSTDDLSGENTRGIIAHVLSRFGYHPESRILLAINHIVRKCAHFTEYAVLAALLFRAYRADSADRWRWKWALYSLAFVVGWAALDEWHQTFTHTRGGSIWDSLLDASGGLFSLAIITLFSLRHGSQLR
jgi:VanZ family protein